MADYKELVSVLRSEADGFLMVDAPDVLMADSLNDAADAIEELVSIADKSKWISPEKAPNTDSGVVGFFNGGAFHQLYWYDFVTTLRDGSIVPENDERDIDNIRCIAVFKLPEPPKEDGK